MDSNSIVENINYYIEEAPSLGLSFVIDGPWGSGKTHFIKNVLKGKKYIYLSLFGCASISQVRREMFYSLSPILRNRIFRDFLGATKSAIKAKTGFDMNSDSREDISLSLDVGALNFWDYFGSERKIIVLDDLERYSGDFAGLFGFVNKLSGEAGCKVVIVSNGSKFDDEGKSVFNEYFDKIVWMQVLFEAPIRDFLQSIRSNSAFSGVDIDFWSIVFEGIDRVIDFDFNSISNFRIINSLLMIINKYKDIIRSKLIEGDRIRGFVTLFSFLFIYIKHEKINFSELEAYRRSKISGENMNHQNESNFINFLELNKENEVLFLKLIEKNYFSKEIIEREVIENILDYQNEIRGKTISNYDSLQLSIISRDDELLSDSFNGVMRELSAGKDFSIFGHLELPCVLP
ncbi:hypothetical protein GCM10011497_15050 [Elstera cyanobacteriorum]|uniref:P-loop NTPase fold protein n=1 Tax=Elstera cyanobacteriorum TaxID=2022747 RepID=UPI00166BE641|nr:P-loop NTPase fold protein [Elstera cyanobacteriorum]GFZ87127.1 hypothetical protein GCM10011497_15050 [Elstera cyanobacteriorum]